VASISKHDPPLCQTRCIHPEAVSQARNSLRDEEGYERLAGLFAALADPTRAKIVHMLLNQELCTCDLAAVLGITDSAVSQHLRILRGGGVRGHASLRLVKSRRMGKFVYYSLDDAHVALLVQVGLTHEGHAQTIAIEPLTVHAVGPS